MDPVVESALVSAAATLVGVGGTVIVAIVGFRNARLTNRATLETARDTNKATLDATREGQLAERYSKAIEQLGSDTIDVTIGSIYALERIALDSARDHSTVMDVLAAFIREHSRAPWPRPIPDGAAHEQSTRPDIQAALTVIGRRDTKNDIRPIDLTHARLTRADLGGAELSHARLDGADLMGANLDGANLDRATLKDANLTEVRFFDANLANAFLLQAKLAGATISGNLAGVNLLAVDATGATLRGDLTGANLQNAKLIGADLEFATLTGANVSGADLTRANLYATHLARVDLSAATLVQAKLAAADLTDADLGNSDLTGADLLVADLTGTRLDWTRWPDDEPVPEGWTLDTGSGRLLAAGTDPRPTQAD